jgi:purine-binding chemotaxis protein CheW
MMDGANRLILCTLHGSRYALRLCDVAEVMEPPRIYPVPRVPQYIAGIMNFHGKLVTVLDLANFLTGACRHPQGEVLVLDTRIANLALWVDSVEHVSSTEIIREERECAECFVEKALMMSAGEVKMLSVDMVLDKIEEILSDISSR